MDAQNAQKTSKDNGVLFAYLVDNGDRAVLGSCLEEFAKHEIAELSFQKCKHAVPVSIGELRHSHYTDLGFCLSEISTLFIQNGKVPRQ